VSHSHSGNDSGIISGINVTPLVDITLVLLIVFIVTAKIIVTPAVPLDLPPAAKTEEVQVVLSVIVPERGPTLVNGEPVGEGSALQARAQEALARDADLRAVVQADGAVPHRRVIAVLDALKSAGVTRIAFGAAPLDHAQP
jgi:biopolymer transport protein TolR